MDPRFLDYYNRELAYLKDLGGEFAQSYPKVAGRLGMQGIDVADPYVERLMEGFAFLAARIHLKIDAEFPRFSQRLLEVVYPHYLAPTPSMAIVQLPLDGEAARGVVGGAVLPRGSQLESGSIPGVATRCTFSTAHDLEVWPVELVDASAGSPGGGLPALGRQRREVKGVIRLSLRHMMREAAAKGLPDRLSFFLSADDAVASRLYELISARSLGVMVSAGPGATGRAVYLPADAIRSEGFAAEQSLLPSDARVFQGYRVLHEYFAFPARFHFFSIGGLERPLRQLGGDAFELTILLDCDPAAIEAAVDRACFALNCVPVINLFKRTGNRLAITPGELEHHLVPDRTRPLDFEVYRVDGVEGFDRGNQPLNRFAPFYHHVGVDNGAAGAYFSARREPRRLSESAARSGGRSSYLGSEVFLSLVDAKEAPWPERVEQLSVEMLLTNRDLPLLMPVNGARDLSVETDLPLRWARILRGPSRPAHSPAERETTWRLISHLSLNYLALRDTDPASGAVALRELLGLYAALGDPVVARQAEAIVSARTTPVTRRLPVSGPLVFGRGVSMRLEIDEVPFAGSSPYLFGAVLEQFLARHVSMNMFTELKLASTTRGEIAAWPPRWGGRPDA